MFCLDAMVSFSPSIVLTTFSHIFFSTCIAFVQWRTRKYCTQFISWINVDCMQYFHNLPTCANPILKYRQRSVRRVYCRPTLKYDNSKKHDIRLTLCHLNRSSSPHVTLSTFSQVLYYVACFNIFIVVGILGWAYNSVSFPNAIL